MILTGKIFKLRCKVGEVVQPPLIVSAQDASAADTETLLHYADTHPGEPVAILTLTEIELDDL